MYFGSHPYFVYLLPFSASQYGERLLNYHAISSRTRALLSQALPLPIAVMVYTWQGLYVTPPFAAPCLLVQTALVL